jgi:hypothetical protein
MTENRISVDCWLIESRTIANSPGSGFAHKRRIILAIMRNGSCLLVSKPYERYY